MGGKSKKQTVGYKYYLGMHQIFCHGPIDAVTRFTVDDRAAWTGNNTGSQINVNAPNLFGGDAREGGVSGLIDIEMGRNTQGKNSYLLSKLGSLIPAYRGVVGAVFRQCYLGNNPYLKATRWRGQRIHVRQDGVEQWYDAKALIASQNPTASAKLIVADVALDANGSSTDGSDGGYLFGLTDGDTLIVTAGSAPWSYTPSDSYPGFPNPYTYKFGIRNTDNGTVYGPYWSEQYLTSAAGTAARAGETLELSLPAGNYKFFLWDATVNDNRFIGHYALSYIPGVADMNPIHIIRECLTDPVWGMGYPDSDIDDTVFQAAADTIYQEGLGMSLLWDKQIKLEEFIDEIKKHIDAAVYVSRKTGKYVIKLIRNDYDPVTLLHLDESNISRIEDPSRTSFGELINSVTVNYWDTVTGKDASLTVTDTALVQVQGAVISTTVQYPGFTTARNATIAGQRDLRTLSSPALSCTVYADSTAKDLNIGDVFKMSWSRWGLSEVIMRVANIAYGTGRNNQVRIECTQDSFDTNTTIVIAPPTTSWDDPSAPPTAPAYEIDGEAPY